MGGVFHIPFRATTSVALTQLSYSRYRVGNTLGIGLILQHPLSFFFFVSFYLFFVMLCRICSFGRRKSTTHLFLFIWTEGGLGPGSVERWWIEFWEMVWTWLCRVVSEGCITAQPDDEHTVLRRRRRLLDWKQQRYYYTGYYSRVLALVVWNWMQNTCQCTRSLKREILNVKNV